MILESLIITFFLCSTKADQLKTTFDGLYVYPTDSCHSYAYDLNRVCRLTTNNNGDYFVDMVEARSRIKSCPSKFLTTPKTEKAVMLNCLFYKDYTYILYRLNDYLHIVRGFYQKTFTTNSSIVGMYFDPGVKNLYAYLANDDLSLVDLDHISNNWDTFSDTAILKIDKTNISLKNATDILLLNNWIYFIKDGYRYKRDFLNNVTNIIYGGYHGAKFDYLLFQHQQEDVIKTGNTLIFAPPDFNAAKDKGGALYLVMYTLTISLVFFIYFILKFLQHKLNNNHGFSSSEEQPMRDRQGGGIINL
jgi:hypothetical protein